MNKPRKLTFGTAKLDTPALFASYRIGDFPRAGLKCHPWAMTDTKALLLNAYDLIANHRTRHFIEDVQKCERKLHGYVEFKGPLMLDSGAYNFITHQDVSITPSKVLEIGLQLHADVSVVLDHPFTTKVPAQEMRKRWRTTIQNTQAMVEALVQHSGDGKHKIRLMPVLHGHDTETLKCALDDVMDIFGGEPEIVGIGSLAPLAQNGSKRTVVDIISTVRDLLPQAHIHSFSLGSALLMLFAFYCGADTVDSQTWIMSAAYKQVQLPGFYLTRLSRRDAEADPINYKKVRYAFAEHMLRLITEEGFAVKDWDTGDDWKSTTRKEALAYTSYLEDKNGTNHIHRRACHNLYAFNFETRRVRQRMTVGTLPTFIEGRLKSTVYKKVLDYAVDKLARH